MKNSKKIIFRVSVLITACVIIGLSIRGIGIKRVINQLDEQIQRAEEQLMVEQQYLEELQEERANMDSLEYIEKVAREKLGMVKKDDIVFKEK